MPPIYIYPREFHRCVELLSHKLAEIAMRSGAREEECQSLESTLAALPSMSRQRASVVLNGIQVQSDEEFPAMTVAARYVLKLAEEIWDGDAIPVAALDAALSDRKPEAS